MAFVIRYSDGTLMLAHINDITLLSSNRTIDLSEPTDLYFKAASELRSTKRHHCISRGDFILAQLSGKDGREIFDAHREEWGIGLFEENILIADDFKRGFLWCFRDHTTSWNDNQKAKNWFLTSPESTFVRRYAFRTCDRGFDECVEIREGSCKEIPIALLTDGDYDVLRSPAFSKTELTNFIETYQPRNGHYEIGEIIEGYSSANPNYGAS